MTQICNRAFGFNLLWQARALLEKSVILIFSMLDFQHLNFSSLILGVQLILQSAGMLYIQSTGIIMRNLDKRSLPKANQPNK